MADGTICLADGLGFKALDSNELRRKHQVSENLKSQQSHPTVLDLEASRVIISGDFNLGSSLRNADPTSSPAGFGACSPKSTKNSSLSRKLQQVFEEALIREAEERATKLQDTTCQFDHQDKEQVQIPNPNPKLLYNALGNPYVEGDPNLGYSLENTRSRYTSRGSSSFSLQPDSNPALSSPTHNPAIELYLSPNVQVVLYTTNTINPHSEIKLLPKLTNSIPNLILVRPNLNLRTGPLYSSLRALL